MITAPMGAPNVDLAPWWGVPVVAGVFLLGGALLGFYFNLILERRRHSQSSLIRWDDDIRSLAAEAIAAAREAVRARQVAAAYYAGFKYAIRFDTEKLPEAQLLKQLQGSETLEDFIERRLKDRPDSPEFLQLQQDQRAAWERLDGARAGLLLIAPGSVCDAARNLADAVGRVIWQEELEDPKHDEVEETIAAQQSVVAAVRSHLGVGRLPA